MAYFIHSNHLRHHYSLAYFIHSNHIRYHYWRISFISTHLRQHYSLAYFVHFNSFTSLRQHYSLAYFVHFNSYTTALLIGIFRSFQLIYDSITHWRISLISTHLRQHYSLTYFMFFILQRKRHNQAGIIKKSVILFWLLNMTILCKDVYRLELLRIYQLSEI